MNAGIVVEAAGVVWRLRFSSERPRKAVSAASSKLPPA
jgi:hypothetical protein